MSRRKKGTVKWDISKDRRCSNRRDGQCSPEIGWQSVKSAEGHLLSSRLFGAGDHEEPRVMSERAEAKPAWV